MPKLGMEAIRRRQVIDAVVEILATHGWRDLTIREVSEVAGVSAGVVTHYFSNKRALTLDAIGDACRQFAQALKDIERRRVDAATRLSVFVDFIARPDPVGAPNWRFWVAIIGRMPFDRVIQAEVQKMRWLYAEFLNRLMAEGIAEGEFEARGQLNDVVTRFMGLTFGLGVAMVADPLDMPPARCRRLLLDQLERELGMDLAAVGPALLAGNAGGDN
jgi:AcrR family transcriptional regulator